MVEIADRKSLKAWLETRPREDAVLIAARAALRVLPLTSLRRVRNDARYRAVRMLLVFRSVAVASLAGRWPGLATDVRAAAAAVFAVASSIVGVVAGARAAASAATAVVFAARAAENTDADAADYPSRVADSANHAARAAATRDFPAADFSAADSAAVWAAVSSDAAALQGGTPHENLGAAPLWPGGYGIAYGIAYGTGTPEWVDVIWRKLKHDLLAAGEGWDVWTDWYDAILAGDPLDPDLELKKALIPDEVWQQGPAALNAEIARLIAEHQRGGGGIPLGPDDEAGTDNEETRRVARAVAAAPVAVAAMASDLHDRIGAEIERVSANLPNEEPALGRARENIAFLEGARSEIGTIADEVSRLPVQPTEADAESVARRIRSFRDLLERYSAWVVGTEDAKRFTNGVLIGGMAAGLMFIGIPPLASTAIAVSSLAGPTMAERIVGFVSKLRGKG